LLLRVCFACGEKVTSQNLLPAAMASNRLFIRNPPQLSRSALPDDCRVAADCLRNNGLALAGASMAQKADPHLVKLAVQQEGLALQFASEDLKATPDIVALAVTQNPYAWRYAADEVRLSTEFLEVAIQESNRLLFVDKQLPREEPQVALEHAFVFVFNTEDKQLRARATLTEGRLHRLPLLRIILDSRIKGFGSQKTDKNGAVVVPIPLQVSPEELRAFIAGRRASISDFLLADYFLDPCGLRQAAIGYLMECSAKSFEASLHNFLTRYPHLVKLVCCLGPELGLPNESLHELFATHCWKRPIPAKRVKNFERTIRNIAASRDTISWKCTCYACQSC